MRKNVGHSVKFVLWHDNNKAELPEYITAVVFMAGARQGNISQSFEKIEFRIDRESEK